MIKHFLSKISKFLFTQKLNKKKTKYLLFCEKRIDVLKSLYITSKESDEIINNIISVGIKKLSMSKFTISGILNDGRDFSIWNSNLWYGWCSSGYFNGVFWNGSINRSNTITPLMLGLLDVDVKKHLKSCPSSSSKSKLREYLLEIDPHMFYEYWDQSRGKNSFGYYQNSPPKIKNYDLTSFNRDKKIKDILK